MTEAEGAVGPAGLKVALSTAPPRLSGNAPPLALAVSEPRLLASVAFEHRGAREMLAVGVEVGRELREAVFVGEELAPRVTEAVAAAEALGDAIGAL